jgi:ABC-type uncharacterized transport system auxiliary subunit
LVQSLLLGSLHNSGRLPAVARPGGLMADVAVMGELEQFEARGPTRPTVQISLNLRLVTQPAGRLIKAQRFSKSVPASSADVDSVVVAFETAMNGILVDAIAFILSALESR